MESKGIFVHGVATCFPTEAIEMYTVLSGKNQVSLALIKTFLKDHSKSPEKRPQKKQNPSLGSSKSCSTQEHTTGF